jgi:hypothetical protein
LYFAQRRAEHIFLKQVQSCERGREKPERSKLLFTVGKFVQEFFGTNCAPSDQVVHTGTHFCHDILSTGTKFTSDLYVLEVKQHVGSRTGTLQVAMSHRYINLIMAIRHIFQHMSSRGPTNWTFLDGRTLGDLPLMYLQ